MIPTVIVVAALVFAAWRQGAYYGRQFDVVEVLVAAAVAVGAGGAVAARFRRRPPFHELGSARSRWSELRSWAPTPAIVAAAGLAATVVLSGLVHYQLRAAAPTFGILAAAAAVASVAAVGSDGARDTLVAGLVGVGGLVAATGWWGVAAHRWPWSLVDGGLWRAASTVTYANATAAVCVPLALLAVSCLVVKRSPAWSLAATVLVVGSVATLCRAGIVALAVGLIILTAVHGVVATARALWPATLGALLATAGLVTSFPATGNRVATTGHPRTAVVFGAAGLVVAVAGTAISSGRAWHHRLSPIAVPTKRGRVAAGTGRLSERDGGGHPRHRRGMVALAAAALVASAGAFVGVAGSAVRSDRLSARSPDRVREWRATWHLIPRHLWVGVGPGPFAVSWTNPSGEVMTADYAHNEYLQVAAQLGLLGTGAMVAGLGGLVWVVYRRRPRLRGSPTTMAVARWTGAVAGLGALGVHSAFDFLWHIPLVPLIGAALLGLVLVRSPTPEAVQ